MKKMKFIPRIIGLIFLTITLTNCSKELSAEKIAARLEPSIVKISSRNQSAHITGFFVSGKTDVCTVLTTANFFKKDGEKILQTNDEKVWNITSIKIFPSNINLALVTFQLEGKKCNYPALKIGSSENLKMGSSIYISGFPMGNKQLVPKFVSSTVSDITQLMQGYGISYTVSTVDGMSGSPVVDTKGEVVAVHGIGNFEIAQILESEKVIILPAAQSTVGQIVNRTKTGNGLNTLHWGIPINLFPKYRVQAFPHYVSLVTEKGVDYTKLRDFLAAKKWEEADKETGKLILEVAGRKSQKWLRREDLRNLSCKDLSIIDKLWLKHSNGKFGFSVQEKIYYNLNVGWYVWKAYQLAGATKEFNEKYANVFGEKVGWREAGEWKWVWDPVNLSTAFVGRLPRASVVGAGENKPSWIIDIEAAKKSPSSNERMQLLFSRVDACRL